MQMEARQAQVFAVFDRVETGKGRRDNYRRFTCGRTGSLARPLWNEFIVGSEQIYAYEIVERENDFGSDLGDDEDESSDP